MKTLKEKMPRESTIEAYLVKRVEARGGKTIKLSGSESGTPDRLVAIPGEEPFLVELKRPKGPGPEALQIQRADEWRAAGMRVYTCHTKVGVDYILGTER